MNARPTGRGNMAARRETAGPAPSQTPVGADSISARFAAAGAPAGGINPSPTNHGRPAANRGKRGLAVISDLCRGRCSHRPADPAAAQGSAGGPWPLPTNMANARPNGKGTRPPAAVGRDALIPPHPAATGTPAGEINPSPTNHGSPRPNGENAALRLYRTSVGDDACTAPAGAFRRPTGPQARLLGRRSSREPRGGARFRGRAMALPYKPW